LANRRRPMPATRHVTSLIAALVCVSCGDPAADCRRIRLGDPASTYAPHFDAEASLISFYESPPSSPIVAPQFSLGPALQDYCCDARIADAGSGSEAKCANISCEGLGTHHSTQRLTEPYSFQQMLEDSPDPQFDSCQVGVRGATVSSVWLKSYRD
jgi:hypothetical protein